MISHGKQECFYCGLLHFHFHNFTLENPCEPWLFLTGAVHSFTVMPLPAFRPLDAPKSSCPSHSPFPSFFLLQGYLSCCNPPCHIVFKNANGPYNGNYKTAEILVLLWLSSWGRNALFSEERMGRITNKKFCAPRPVHPPFLLFCSSHIPLGNPVVLGKPAGGVEMRPKLDQSVHSISWPRWLVQERLVTHGDQPEWNLGLLQTPCFTSSLFCSGWGGGVGMYHLEVRGGQFIIISGCQGVSFNLLK